MDLGLRDRVYVVSGGSKGLGRAAAEVLVAEGARVVIVARDAHAVSRTVAELGPAAVGLPADLAVAGTAASAVEVAMARFGQVDGGVISVGGPPPGSVLTTSDDQWRAAFDSVFLGSVRLARALCEGIMACGRSTTGALAWVLSTSAVEVFTGLTTSNGLRPGLGMLIKDLADEVGPTGIRVNGLLPGRIATDRLATLDAATGDAAAARARASAGIPLRRYGEPEEFGRVAAFLLSPASSYVTGSLVRVDGGSTRHAG
jgi:3-oxoacyl-[acyl-carrier protein] reductase